jgi:hypothetical protein
MPDGYNLQMLSQYHIEIMLASLGDRFSARAMSEIIQANVNQDRLSGLVGHDEFHCDNNAFEKTYAYIKEQRGMVTASLEEGKANPAWQALGRFLHAVQDFYAHSNYITLWLDRFDGNSLPPPPEVDAMNPDIIHNSDLRSGKIYLPIEALYIFNSMRPFVKSILPYDSHAWMNLDSPEQGFKFDYAMQAAIKRTVIEFNKTTQDFSDDICRLFLDE